ncbi:MAG TPA: hypothetical protein VL147_01605 [Devosia sp.]|nr:hypothetical protein [Devosia sp.]
MASTLTRRALLAGAGTTIASAAIAVPYVNAAHADEVCGLPLDAASPDERLKSAVGYVRSILEDMGCDEYVLMMREEASGILVLLDFEPGTGTLKRKIDLA